MLSNSSKRAGFSLIEILVAGVILATGSVLIIQSITSSLEAASYIHQRANAIRTAENQLVLFANDDKSPTQGTETIDHFIYDWAITTRNDSSNLTRAICTVQWMNGSRTYEFALERLYLDQGESP